MKNSGCVTAAFCKVEYVGCCFFVQISHMSISTLHKHVANTRFLPKMVGHLNPKTNPVRVLALWICADCCIMRIISYYFFELLYKIDVRCFPNTLFLLFPYGNLAVYLSEFLQKNPETPIQ